MIFKAFTYWQLLNGTADVVCDIKQHHTEQVNSFTPVITLLQTILTRTFRFLFFIKTETTELPEAWCEVKRPWCSSFIAKR
jgi:hypothetical protein